MKREFSAGGIVYKKEGDRVLWLLIQPKDTNRWQFPKGWIEAGETAKAAALREVEEETGVIGEMITRIGRVSWWFVENGEKIFKTTTYFLIEAKESLKQFDKEEIEKIAWVSFAKAQEKLTFDSAKKALKQAEGVLANRLF